MCADRHPAAAGRTPRPGLHRPPAPNQPQSWWWSPLGPAARRARQQDHPRWSGRSWSVPLPAPWPPLFAPRAVPDPIRRRPRQARSRAPRRALRAASAGFLSSWVALLSIIRTILISSFVTGNRRSGLKMGQPPMPPRRRGANTAGLGRRERDRGPAAHQDGIQVQGRVPGHQGVPQIRPVQRNVGSTVRTSPPKWTR